MSVTAKKFACFAPSDSASPLAPREGSQAPMAACDTMGVKEHFVQFYEEDDFLIRSVGRFVESGFTGGDSAIVIATPAHLNALEGTLRERGVDLAGLRASGRLVELDAAQTLAQFMVDGAPDKARFEAVVGKVVDAAARAGRQVRAFGEMVALLWADGNTTGAIALEELWNELGETRNFALFCAYPMRAFRGDRNGQPFLHVCRAHTRVIPAESYAAEPDEDARLRTISLLQQKATVLEAEIEERRQAERGLREQKTKLAVAATIAQLGVWEVDIEQRTLTCSEQCREHFGLDAQVPATFEVMMRLVHADDRPALEKAFRDAIATGTDYSTEFRVLLSNGKVRWLAAMGRRSHPGSRRVLGVTFDITTRREAAEVLERTVTERTTELRSMVAELEAFSYSISHDMRAPLRSMRGFAEILMTDHHEKLDPECRNYLARISAAGERMDRLIQDVLTFSRVSRADLKFEIINLDHLVRGILECYPNLQPPQAEIAIDGTLPPVFGNAAALTQCLSNLLGNAVKFVPPGVDPVVRIWAERVVCRDPNRTAVAPAAIAMVRLCIKDNGIGIPAEAHEKIFGIFHRLGKNYEGTGIGLAIVKKAAERMGGAVGLSSAPGLGSTFWLDLQSSHG
jgi:PAS domain S-box-containing protein